MELGKDEPTVEAIRSPKSARIGWGLASRSLLARRGVHVGLSGPAGWFREFPQRYSPPKSGHRVKVGAQRGPQTDHLAPIKDAVLSLKSARIRSGTAFRGLDLLSSGDAGVSCPTNATEELIPT